MADYVPASPDWYGVCAPSIYEKESFPVVAWMVVDRTVHPLFAVESFGSRWTILISPDGHVTTRDGRAFSSWNEYYKWLDSPSGGRKG